MPGFRIALLLQGRHNDYQTLLQSDCEQTARRNDLSLTVLSAEKSVDVQIRQLRALLAESERTRPRALLVSAVSEMPLMPLIADAAKLGIVWVLLSRWNPALQDFRLQYPQVPIFSVLPDQVEIGRIQGRQLSLLVRAGEELVSIQGPSGTYSTRQRRSGLESALADKPKLSFSYFNGDWSQASGASAMQSWLSTFTARTLPPFAIAAQNDNMAMGAREAYLAWAARHGQVPRNDLVVVGCDGSPSFGLRLVEQGQLRATVVVPSVSGRAVDEVVAALRFGQKPLAETKVAVRSHSELVDLMAAARR